MTPDRPLRPSGAPPYDGAMTAKQYQAAIDAIGLSQRSAAKFLGVHERTSRKWIAGGPIPEPVALLLRYMVRHKLTPQDIRPEWEQ